MAGKEVTEGDLQIKSFKEKKKKLGLADLKDLNLEVDNRSPGDNEGDEMIQSDDLPEGVTLSKDTDTKKETRILNEPIEINEVKPERPLDKPIEIVIEESKENEAVDVDGTLVSNMKEALEKNGNIPASAEINEEEKRQERLTYLATQLVDDMEVFYGGDNVDKREATRRLEDHNIQKILQKEGPKEGYKDWFLGKKYARELGDFFARMRDWKDFPGQSKTMLEALGLNLEELREARSVEKRRIVDEAKKGGKLVWYTDMLNDLKLTTYLDNDLRSLKLSEEKLREARQNAFNRLINKGLLLPDISTYQKHEQAYANRQKLRAAVEFLKDKTLERFEDFWKSRREAIGYLSDIGIGEGKGVDYLKGSVEERRNKQPVRERREGQKTEQQSQVKEEVRETKVKEEPSSETTSKEEILSQSWVKSALSLVRNPKYQMSSGYADLLQELKKVGLTEKDIRGY